MEPELKAPAVCVHESLPLLLTLSPTHPVNTLPKYFFEAYYLL
jgi:hypothetical protein